MRKYNSSFKTAFISEAGSRLKNNDYFGFVELDKYACYVIADGITDMRDSQSAREAIECVINAFHNAPGISKRKIKQYLQYANAELLKGKSYEKLKASITVVVTNYEKCRYGYAGNTRLRIYRNGRKLIATSDTSLGQDMAGSGQITEDKLSKHEERNNLYSFLGKKKFKPVISKKIRLMSGDIITLYTRGIWENVDEGELADVFSEAGNEPAEECDKVEDMLLSRQPEDLENYTFAAIYVDKVFTNPERKKRIKKTVLITLLILLLTLAVILVIWLWQRDRGKKRDDMELHFANAEAYVEDNNFVRASEECEKALELAAKLRDREKENQFNSWMLCLEVIKDADESYEKGDYEEAKETYLKAKARIRYADNAGSEYIERKLQQIEEYEQVFDNISLGDNLFDLDHYQLAEEKYLEAKKKAASIHFDDGRRQALEALDALYEEWSAAAEAEKEQDAEQSAAEVSAADLVRQGDETYGEGDYDGALVFYLIALEKYTKLEDVGQIAVLNKKIIALNEIQEETEARVDEAKLLVEQARLSEEEKDYEQAKIQYQQAKAIYAELGKDNKVNEIQSNIELTDMKKEKEEKARADEEKDGDTVSGNELEDGEDNF